MNNETAPGTVKIFFMRFIWSSETWDDKLNDHASDLFKQKKKQIMDVVSNLCNFLFFVFI